MRNSWSSLVKMSFVTTAAGGDELDPIPAQDARTNVVRVAEVTAECESERRLA
jgi:hypothetical protein